MLFDHISNVCVSAVTFDHGMVCISKFVEIIDQAGRLFQSREGPFSSALNPAAVPMVASTQPPEDTHSAIAPTP